MFGSIVLFFVCAATTPARIATAMVDLKSILMVVFGLEEPLIDWLDQLMFAGKMEEGFGLERRRWRWKWSFGDGERGPNKVNPRGRNEGQASLASIATRKARWRVHQTEIRAFDASCHGGWTIHTTPRLPPPARWHDHRIHDMRQDSFAVCHLNTSFLCASCFLV